MSIAVDSIPELIFNDLDFESLEFEELASRISAVTDSTSIPSIEYTDLQSGTGKLITSKEDRLARQVSGKHFEKDDVLFGYLRPYLRNWHHAEEAGKAVGDFWVLRSKSNIDSRYLFYVIQSDRFQQAASISTGTKMPRADWKLVSKENFRVPSLESQSRTGLLFGVFDDLISLQEQKIVQLEDVKRTMLAKMFPKKGEDRPELRFAGFTDAWEQRKLKEIAEFNPKSVLPNEFEYVDLGSVIGTDLVAHRTEKKETAPSRAQRLAQKGDVFYQTVRPYQKNNYLYDLLHDNYVFSTGYAQMRPKVDSYFLLSIIQEEKFVQRVLDRSTGTGYPAINSTDLAELEVQVPAEIDEQKVIGNLFRMIDNLITLHQRKVDEMKDIKQTLLQKMFV